MPSPTTTTTITSLIKKQENKNIGEEEARGDDICKFKVQNTRGDGGSSSKTQTQYHKTQNIKQTNKKNQNPKKNTKPNPKRETKLEVLKKTRSNSEPLLQKEPKTKFDFD